MTIIIIILAIALQVFLSVKKVSPFLSLIFVAILTGLCLDIQPEALMKTVEKGVASTLGGLALIICLGAILGKILEISGAAEQISSTLIKSFGLKNIQWAVLLTGFLIGIPLFYNAGFVILVPLGFYAGKKNRIAFIIYSHSNGGISQYHALLSSTTSGSGCFSKCV
jgi:Gnt-I system high-affinity gluconate transporter